MKKVVLIGVVLVVIGALGYFFLWRPSDTVYTDAINQLDGMKQSSSSLDSLAKSISSPYVASKISTVTDLKTKVDAFNSAYDKFVALPAVTKDSAVGSTYTANKTTLLAYKTSANDLLRSVTDFAAVAAWCGTLQDQLKNIQSTNDFDKQAKPCTDAIASAKNAHDANMKEQLLDDYGVKAEAAVTAFKKLILARTDKSAQATAITTANQAVKNLQKAGSGSLTLSISPDPSTVLQKMTEVVNRQKSAFLR